MLPPRSSSVPVERMERLDRIHRLIDDEESKLELMNQTRDQIHRKKYVSSDSDTYQGEGITSKLKFAARHLNDRIQLHTSGVSYEYSELPTTSEHDQMLVNQSNEFPVPLRKQHHFNKLVRENVLLLIQEY